MVGCFDWNPFGRLLLFERHHLCHVFPSKLCYFLSIRSTNQVVFCGFLSMYTMEMMVRIRKEKMMEMMVRIRKEKMVEVR
jgi:hypothetical protein